MDYTLIVLPLATFLTSAITGVVGMGGGLLLLLILAEFLPFAVLIPIHGINQLVTHFSRAVISLKNIDKRISIRFAVGAILGAAAGSQFVMSMSEEIFKILLGLFVLFCLILPKLKIKFRLPYKWPIVGGFASFLGIFIGNTGVIIAPFFLIENLKKEQLVATKAACQVFIHSSKVAVFFILGFTLGPYLLLVTLMCITSFMGAYVSKRLLGKISEKRFTQIFIWTIIILSVRLIIGGISDLV